MNSHDALLNAALQVLKEEGEAQFTTRSVFAIAKVTAPTLYHHFGSADGLLSAAIKEAFAQFLESKRTATQSFDLVMLVPDLGRLRALRGGSSTALRGDDEPHSRQR
ncbi:TetR/AcrR family transcriptional regulator [Paenibacillus pabuli]|uniref:TetR/AcrR family transcriptional regulator n=1 Tax=Paenibacillus pabuli TaxID=1472 RepID=UPI0020004E52|nr:TetR/AcrR family transcriptional regulator [Paenibacillus pabuli]